MSRTFQAEFQKTKTLLRGFLGRTFLDSSLLLGFVTINQQSFQKFLINDFDQYLLTNSQKEEEIEFLTIKYLELFWSDFHYPIVKYFQSQSAELFSNINADFKRSQQDGRKFTVRPVEARKLHENFMKYLKVVYLFYLTLLKHFCTQYANPYMPDKIMKAFGFELAQDAKDSLLVSSRANLLYLVHKVLLCLGDLQRHRTFMETSYIMPCMSVKEYFGHRDISGRKKTEVWKPKYERALQLYSFCILLLPALNEPYNHMGMIYNLIDDKFHACLWLLRSQFTRLPEYQLGLTNLKNILKKNTFISSLKEIDSKSGRGATSFNPDDLNIYLICLICYFFVPEVYKKGPNIVKGISFSRLENKLFKSIEDNLKNLLSISDTFNGTFLVEQLTVLFTFNDLIFKSTPKSSDISMKFNRFSYRFIERILECGSQFKDFDDSQKANYLKALRLTLAWIKENKQAYRVFVSRYGTMEKLASVLNSLLSQDSIDSETQNSYTSTSQEASEFLKTTARPTRSFYFEEDVQFRDFLLIKFQFKDFKDDHLFASGNIDLLVGDYSSYHEDSDIPTFLDNQSISRIKRRLEKNSHIISEEVTKYVNSLRTIAVLVLGKRLMESINGNIHYDVDTARFIIKPIVKEKQYQKTSNVTRANDAKETSGGSTSVTPQANASVRMNPTIEDIESVISNHASKMVFENDLESGIGQGLSRESSEESPSIENASTTPAVTDSVNHNSSQLEQNANHGITQSNMQVHPQLSNMVPLHARKPIPGFQGMPVPQYQQQPQGVPYHPQSFFYQPMVYGNYPPFYTQPIQQPPGSIPQMPMTYPTYHQ